MLPLTPVCWGREPADSLYSSRPVALSGGSRPPLAGAPTEEHLILEFRDGVRVYVPVSKIDLVQKYVGGSRTEPQLSRYGGTSWQHNKDKVEAAVIDLAGDMVDLQALREAQPGIAFPSDTEW